MDERGEFPAHHPKARFNEDVCPIGSACLHTVLWSGLKNINKNSDLRYQLWQNVFCICHHTDT